MKKTDTCEPTTAASEGPKSLMIGPDTKEILRCQRNGVVLSFTNRMMIEPQRSERRKNRCGVGDNSQEREVRARN